LSEDLLFGVTENLLKRLLIDINDLAPAVSDYHDILVGVKDGPVSCLGGLQSFLGLLAFGDILGVHLDGVQVGKGAEGEAK